MLSEEELKEAIDTLLKASLQMGIVDHVFPQSIVSEDWKKFFEEKGLMVFGQDEIPPGHQPARVSFLLPEEIPFKE